MFLQLLKRILRRETAISQAVEPARAIPRQVSYQGMTLARKDYRDDPNGIARLERELCARRLLGDRPWMLPLSEHGTTWTVTPALPHGTRLDLAAPMMTLDDRREAAVQFLSGLLEAHSENLFWSQPTAADLNWLDGQLVVSRFDDFLVYPTGARPAFPLAYGLIHDSPRNSGASVDDAVLASRTPVVVEVAHILRGVLGLNPGECLAALLNSFHQELQKVCSTFEKAGRRHVTRVGRIYGSFALPYFGVPAEEAQRDSARRLRRFGVSPDDLHGATVLDLGCNIGAMLFASQQFRPRRCLGVEFDAEKVMAARKIAALNGIDNVEFLHGNVDEVEASTLGGKFDVVYCLALLSHVRDPKRLFRLLAEVTGHFLYFEGNRRDQRHVIQSELIAHGFTNVRYLGDCDDDCVPSNNVRPIYVAHRSVTGPAK